jgi:hypothetical protein
MVALRKEQLTFMFRKRGGARWGAGRPSQRSAGVSHDRRPAISKHRPVHVTVRLVSGIWNLRSSGLFRRVHGLLVRLSGEMPARVVHYSVQKTHLHFIIEAEHRRALSRAMRMLGIRLAKAVNGFMNRRGQVVRERYHARILKTPLEVKRAIAYVLSNTRHHAAERGHRLPTLWLDPCSSAAAFDGWIVSTNTGFLQHRQDAVTRPPQSWLLAVGWRRHGRIEVDYVPGR